MLLKQKSNGILEHLYHKGSDQECYKDDKQGEPSWEQEYWGQDNHNDYHNH